MGKNTICSKQDFIEIIRSDKKSIRRISIESGIPQTTIENWLYGTSMPTLDKVCMVLKTLGYTITIQKEKA